MIYKCSAKFFIINDFNYIANQRGFILITYAETRDSIINYI